MNPAPSETGPGTLTQAIYNASLDPARRALIEGATTGPFVGIPYRWLTDKSWYSVNLKLGYSPASEAAAKVLLATAQLSGLPIDEDLMLSRWPAPGIMAMRQIDGYGYVPPYGSTDVNVMPGLPPPSGEVSNYPASMPPGWILVSTDAKDYPAYVPPAGPVVVIVWTPVMNEMFSYFDRATGVTHYFFGLASGQNPPLGTKAVFEGLNFVAANYPPGDQSPMDFGGALKMWMLVA